VATGHGAVGRHRATLCFVRQRFLFHVAQIACSLGMTGLAPSNTIPRAAVVIHSNGRPASLAGMTGIACHASTQLRLRNMVGGFSGRRRPVMAAVATARRNAAVAHRRGCPGGGAVAGIARSRGRDVARVLARSGGAVVTGITGARRNAAMFHRGRRPSRRAVTGIARRSSGSVPGVLARSGGAVVAGIAGARRDAAVTENGWRPTAGTMTGIATRSRWNMVYRFDGCSHPVT